MVEKEQKKKISIIVPCYNEENSILKMYDIICNLFSNELNNYDFDIIYVDDYSRDNTRNVIKKLCTKDTKHVKAIFNSSNFGFSRNIFSCLQYGDGDATFLVFGDLQDPPELLPKFINEWNKGYSVVIGQKTGSDEGKVISLFRKLYYNLIGFLSDTKQIKNFNGFGLYDKSFVSILSQIDDMQPYLKQVVSEYASDYGVVEYKHHISTRGSSNFNLYRNYDFAMDGITSSTKKLMRLSTLLSAIIMTFSLIYAIYVFIKKIMYWDSYPIGTASLIVGIFILGSIILFFIGVLGEYILSINTKTLKRPRVVISDKINF